MLHTYYVPYFSPENARLFCVRTKNTYFAKVEVGHRTGTDPFRVGQPEDLDDPLEMFDNHITSMPLKEATVHLIKLVADDPGQMNDLALAIHVMTGWLVDNNERF